jgi:D-3-phosphoglycerate dehydrogenase / 2-oxoglutarate reductase
MVKYTIKTYNTIAKVGLDQLGPDVIVAPDTEEPDAIILRSQDLHNLKSNDNLQAVARAGAGVNNIPVQAMSAKGIVVFNTPGANANAVKEAVLAGLLIAARNVVNLGVRILRLK